MSRPLKRVLLVVLLSVSCCPLVVRAQTTDESVPPTSKQAAKAQRKAARKEHRAKTNAELGALEKNGYKPSGDRTTYPQDLQKAQAKQILQKGTVPIGASAP